MTVPVAAVALTVNRSSGDTLIGFVSTGAVKVLLVRVCVPVRVVRLVGNELVPLDKSLFVKD